MKIIDKKRFLPLGLASFLLFMSAPALAQSGSSENTVVVTGIVTDAALGTPMAGVKVQAYNNALHSAMTKEDRLRSPLTDATPLSVRSMVRQIFP